MRKFLLALIACLVAVIAYASPGSPYLSYGWRPTGGGASIAFVNSASVGGQNGGTTASTNMSGANFFVAYVARGSAAITLSDSSTNTWTLFSTTNNGGGDFGYLYYAANATSTATQTFTVSGANSFSSVCVMGFSGVLTASPVDGAGAANSAFASGTSVQPGSVTPSANNELVVAGVLTDNATISSPTVNSSFSTPPVNSIGGYASCQISYLIQGTAAAVNPTFSWTTAANSYSQSAVFKHQ